MPHSTNAFFAFVGWGAMKFQPPYPFALKPAFLGPAPYCTVSEYAGEVPAGFLLSPAYAAVME
jgi:hypothetical protein